MNSFACFIEVLLEGEDIHKLLKTIREDVGIDVAWKDIRTGAVFCSGISYFCERATTYPLKELMRLYTFREVHLSHQLLGYLFLNMPPSFEKNKEESIVNSLAAIQLFYRQKMVQEKMESEYRNNFVQDLLYGRIVHQEELLNRAKTFHFTYPEFRKSRIGWRAFLGHVGDGCPVGDCGERALLAGSPCL
jgi:hypothetical protein